MSEFAKLVSGWFVRTRACLACALVSYNRMRLLERLARIKRVITILTQLAGAFDVIASERDRCVGLIGCWFIAANAEFVHSFILQGCTFQHPTAIRLHLSHQHLRVIHRFQVRI